MSAHRIVYVVEIRFSPGRWYPDQVYATRREAEQSAERTSGWPARVREYAPVATKRAKGGAN